MEDLVKYTSDIFNMEELTIKDAIRLSDCALYPIEYTKKFSKKELKEYLKNNKQKKER